jgi:GNAT superfamily N-acetyltransferase
VEVSIRIGGPADVATLAGLRRAWSAETAGDRATDDGDFDAAFRAWWEAEHDTRTFFLAEAQRTPIGMANVKRYDRMPSAGRASAGCWGYVGNVFVLAPHRDTGVGAVLMRAIVDWATGEGLEHLRLAPSPRSVPFYGRLGFVPGAVVELDPPRR